MTLLETKPQIKNNHNTPRRRPSPRRRKILIGVAVLFVLGLATWLATGGARQAPPPPVATPPAILSAHGVVQPVARATVASMSGGVVRSLSVKVGQTVTDRQPIAEVTTSERTEMLVAPWAGTIVGLSVQRGDTILPGAPVAIVADLSRYQVETTDVDEYLIGQIRPGQQVAMTVEALDGRQINGVVDTVAYVQQTSSDGVANYPTVIRLVSNEPDLRPGMSVRIVFAK